MWSMCVTTTWVAGTGHSIGPGHAGVSVNSHQPLGPGLSLTDGLSFSLPLKGICLIIKHHY